MAENTGFDLCGITGPTLQTDGARRFRNWLEKRFHGEMDYLSRNRERRSDPYLVMPEIRSIIVLGLNYYQQGEEADRVGYGRVSRYARGRDYHKVISRMLKKLIAEISGSCAEGLDAHFKAFVDYGPLMERAYAEQAGLGFIGKNGMLINKDFGSWFFIAAILTDLELKADRRDPKVHGSCGSCRKCIKACPTDAIYRPRQIDARRCISYLTIERPSEIPDELGRNIGSRFFGCDICQEVCPHNEQPVRTDNAELTPEGGVGEYIDLEEILGMSTRDQFLEMTAGTPLTRPRLEGLQRNARIVRSNMSNEADNKEKRLR